MVGQSERLDEYNSTIPYTLHYYLSHSNNKKYVTVKSSKLIPS